MTIDNCIFCKIVAGQIPAKKIYEDEKYLAFHDIDPKAPVHALLIPKQHIVSILHLQPNDVTLIAGLLSKVPELAQALGVADFPSGGFRFIANSGDNSGQEVHHLHFHLIGGKKLGGMV